MSLSFITYHRMNMFLKSIEIGLSSDICHVPTIPQFNSSLIASIILNAVSLSLIQQRINNKCIVFVFFDIRTTRSDIYIYRYTLLACIDLS